MSTTVYRTSHDFMAEVLRGALLTAFESGAAGGIGSVPCRAGAALYALLMNHPIDQQGRCRHVVAREQCSGGVAAVAGCTSWPTSTYAVPTTSSRPT